ncbi:MAG: ABC transporter permease [Ilumatobacteraceae bacterium]
MFPTQTDAGPGLTDAEVLDEYLIPFGSWIEETVNWTTLNLEGVLDGIAWPFEFLLENIVDNFLLSISWLYVVVIMFGIAWLVRNLTVAVGTAVGLVLCGLLGQEFWIQTARTIGFILVAVIVCIIIGIPLGILSGRFESVWKVMRPTLDAMQVIHAFVYLLPFVYFWGVGRVSATMATMVFALPPLIRLTNLGIRGVPEDVVEASRAYGANELRVLRDVQLPLARPAIMTGINQTLLLAFSMLGIAAILGAGGLGALLFRALGQQDVNLAAAAGLSFFLLAVILDRISQTEAGSKSLFTRMSTAWKARKEPEQLLIDPDFNPAASRDDHEVSAEGDEAPLSSGERGRVVVTLAGAVIMLLGIPMTWAAGGPGLSAYGRRDDVELTGQSFSGLAAEGGSWFSFIIAFLAIFVGVACVAVLSGRGSARWFSADGITFGSIAALLTSFGYVIARPSAFTPDYSVGTGAWVSFVGAVVAVVASLSWMAVGAYGPHRPLRRRVAGGPIVLGVIAALMAVVSIFSMWHLDERGGVVMTPEIQAEMDAVKAAAKAGEIDPGVAATEIQVIRARAKQDERIIIDGSDPAGVGLGTWTLVFGLAGTVGAAVAAGAAGFGDRRRWIGGTVAMGLGLGIAGFSLGFVATLVRVADQNYYSGVGAMFAMFVGSLLFAAGSGLVKGFERAKIYRDISVGGETPGGSESEAAVAVDDEEKATVSS